MKERKAQQGTQGALGYSLGALPTRIMCDCQVSSAIIVCDVFEAARAVMASGGRTTSPPRSRRGGAGSPLSPRRRGMAIFGFDYQTAHRTSHSRRAKTPGALQSDHPRENRGRRESRMLVAPAASRAKVESTRVSHHRLDRDHAGLPCANGFNGFLRALPGDRALLPPSFANCRFANLIPASGDQDHTTSPSAMQRIRLMRRPRPPHPHPTFVTIAIRPSVAGCGRRGVLKMICPTAQAEYFSP
jgi:hypothetical protein